MSGHLSAKLVLVSSSSRCTKSEGTASGSLLVADIGPGSTSGIGDWPLVTLEHDRLSIKVYH